MGVILNSFLSIQVSNLQLVTFRCAFHITSELLDTLSDVLSSSLPWGLILYGEEEEQIMEASKDEVIQQIWQVKYKY